MINEYSIDNVVADTTDLWIHAKKQGVNINAVKLYEVLKHQYIKKNGTLGNYILDTEYYNYRMQERHNFIMNQAWDIFQCKIDYNLKQ